MHVLHGIARGVAYIHSRQVIHGRRGGGRGTLREVDAGLACTQKCQVKQVWYG